MATAGEEEEGDGGDGAPLAAGQWDVATCGVGMGSRERWEHPQQEHLSRVPITLAPGLEQTTARVRYGDKVPGPAAGTAQPPCREPAAGSCQGLWHEEEEEEDDEEEDKDEEDKDEEDKEKEEEEKEC